MLESEFSPVITTEPSTHISFPSASNSEIYDVVIVGAGPVGLATAIGLQERGIQNFIVIDQTRTFRQVGQAIDLAPNGLKALKCLSPKAYAAVKEASAKIFQAIISQKQETISTSTETQKPAKVSLEWVIRNFQGERVRALDLQADHWVEKYGEGRLSLPWYELQTTLRQLLPSEKIKANHRCINVVDEPELGFVRVDCVSSTGEEVNPYLHWEEEQNSPKINPENAEPHLPNSPITSIRGKLVVAADGINSRVRKVLYQNSSYSALAKPEYSGFSAILCREVAEIPSQILEELEEKFFQSGQVVTIFSEPIGQLPQNQEISSIILFKRPGFQLGYMLHVPLPLESLTGKSGNSLIELALLTLQKVGFPDVIQQLIQISPPEKIQQRPYYIHRTTLSDDLPFPRTADLNQVRVTPETELEWYANRVVLVGDAAHGMPPFMAQGGNQGLEDALTMAVLIADLGQKNLWDDPDAITAAFQKYQSVRQPFLVKIQQATLQQLSYSSEAEWQKYSERVYSRDFEQFIQDLLNDANA